MSADNTFRTKFGHCTIEDGKLIIRRGKPRADGKPPKRNTLPIMQLVYAVIGGYFLWKAYLLYEDGETVFTALYAFAGFVGLTTVALSFGNSGANIIPLDSIQSVEFRPRTKGLTRAYFTVRFKSETGRIRKRLIILPGSLAGGAAEDERAKEVMQRFGLME